MSFEYFKDKVYCTIHKITFPTDSKCPKCSKEGTQTVFTSNSQVITSKSQEVLIKRKYVRKLKTSIFERFHNYGIKFNAEVDWIALFKYEEVKLNNNVSYKRINNSIALIKVFKKSILITLHSSNEVIGLNVRDAELRSRLLINDILDNLPSSIKVKDREIVSLHNAFVNHPNAKHEVNVNINNEKRFISDNSKGYSEFEAIHPKHAISDSEAIEQDIVSLVDKGLSRDFIAQSLLDLVKDREYYAENLKSHVQAIQDLNKGINELREQVRRDRIKSFIDEYR